MRRACGVRKNQRTAGHSAVAAAVLLACAIDLGVAGLPGEHGDDPQAKPAVGAAFTPPDERAIPNDEFGAMVRFGQQVFVDTAVYAPKYVGNGLSCVNCHLDQGRLANSAPLWAAWVSYPAYRKKTGRVDTYEERLQGCFRYSMNGTAPASGSRELTALVTYSYWLATNAPVGATLQGRGYPELPKPASAPDIARGAQVYADRCAVCHGTNGAGTKIGARYAFPPLWGPNSFNWGAGMHRVNTAAGFIRANMPLGNPNSLSIQEAWDVAAYVTSRERPADPRQTGSIAQAKKTHHDEMCYYGESIDGRTLGEGVSHAGKLSRLKTAPHAQP